MNRTAIVCSIISGLSLLGFGAILSAGPLDPPAGPVGPTYKTLAEVEPRIAINAVNTPGDANSLFKITQPGSYYLTGNVTGETGKHGIEIGSTGVSIDLNGFEVRGVAGSLDGITNSSFSIERVAVRNGTVRDWGGAGVRLSSNSFSGSVESIVSTGNGTTGIAVGNTYTVARCAAYSNTADGFFSATSTVFTQCTSRENGASGFSVTSGNVLNECIAYANTGNGFTSSFQGNSFIQCVASENSLGFFVSSDALVSNCIARLNSGDGIRCSNDSTIISNSCIDNGTGTGGGAGIHITSSDNRIEGNNCTGADRGIDVDISGNIIIRNTCSGNTTNWTIAAGNHYGPIIDRTVVAAPPSVNGNAATEALGSTHPNANFTY